MREILFRGKQIDNEEWACGSFCMDAVEQFNGLCGVDGFIRLYDKTKGKSQTYEVDRETVGQYTGLTDKNGKRIFEGDIVRHHNGHPDALEEIGAVFWDERTCGWRRTSNGAFYRGIIDTYRMSRECVYEVLGNIYDNPDLMGGSGDGS